MGCDIHAHAEVKLNNTWHHLKVLNIPRSYSLFGRIAGVRGDVDDAITKPRGLPENITDITKAFHVRWFGDAHTPTWLNFTEVAQLTKEGHDLDLGYQLLNINADLLSNCKDYPFTDMRLICWFDN